MRTEDKNRFSTLKCLLDKTYEQTVDVDLNLPDYCYEIVRILHCFAQPNLIQVQRTEGKITIDGYVRFAVLYISKDSNQPRSYVHLQNFTKSFDIKTEQAGEDLSVKLKSEYVNVRATSSRGISIKSSVSVLVKMNTIESGNFAYEADSPDIQLKTEDITLSRPICFAEKNFMTEIEPENQYGDIDNVLYARCFPHISEYKIINGKAMVKGELDLQAILLCSDGGIHTISQKISFNQFTAVGNVDSNALCSIVVDITDCKEELSQEIDGSECSLRFVITCKLKVMCYEEVTVSHVLDGYSTLYQTECEYVKAAVARYQPIPHHSQSIVKKIVVDSQVKRVLSCTISPFALTEHAENSVLSCGGTVTLITESDDERLHTYTKSIDFLLDLPARLPCNVKNLILTADDINCIGDQNSVQVTFQALAQCLCEYCESTDVLSDLHVDTDQLKGREPGVALMIYYASAKESVWDIAKKYNTTVNQIVQANSLTDPVIQEKRALLIPMVTQ